MKNSRWMLLMAAVASFGITNPASAGLFKIDFGHIENEREKVDSEGTPTGEFPEVLQDWDVIPTWTLLDPNANVSPGSASINGTANDEATQVTWKLKDFSGGGDNDVTLTIFDNLKLTEALDPNSPPYMLGMAANNPTKEGLTAVYDGVVVPSVVKDDYLYRNPDTAGTESLMRFGGLNPGFYNVTVFEGRTTDGNGRYGKVWVDDINGKNEPASQNTGNYAGVNAAGVPVPLGQPRTVTVEVKAGQYLWFAEMEDNSGGISGMIVRSVTSVPPPVDIANSQGLFKIDFGHIENERANDAGEVPAPLADWTVIPTWTFAEPNVNVTPGSASAEGTANAEGTEVTWKLKDASKLGLKNVTMTILDNVSLTASLSIDPAQGQTANNPTKDAYEAIYDGVVVPAIVKDDYLYRNPDTAGSEVLMRFAGLPAGTYNVTVFEGRTTDGNGRYGKVWVDDIKGLKIPAAQNTGNYSGVNLDVGGVATPTGNPRTVTVTLKAGEYLWFAEMEDSSGGISGMIVRGVAPVAPAIELVGSSSLSGTYSSVSGATVDATGKKITLPKPSAAAGFYRVKGANSVSVSVDGNNLVFRYQ
ncbi:MAG: hypothetical protein WCR07_14875 [Verrucomicrobiota bacterium]|jgi:hypothetical protein